MYQSTDNASLRHLSRRTRVLTSFSSSAGWSLAGEPSVVLIKVPGIPDVRLKICMRASKNAGREALSRTSAGIAWVWDGITVFATSLVFLERLCMAIVGCWRACEKEKNKRKERTKTEKYSPPRPRLQDQVQSWHRGRSWLHWNIRAGQAQFALAFAAIRNRIRGRWRGRQHKPLTQRLAAAHNP